MKLSPRIATILRDSAAQFIRSDKLHEFYTADGKPESDPRYVAAVNGARAEYHAALAKRYGDSSWEV